MMMMMAIWDRIPYESSYVHIIRYLPQTQMQTCICTTCTVSWIIVQKCYTKIWYSTVLCAVMHDVPGNAIAAFVKMQYRREDIPKGIDLYYLCKKRGGTLLDTEYSWWWDLDGDVPFPFLFCARKKMYLVKLKFKIYGCIHAQSFWTSVRWPNTFGVRKPFFCILSVLPTFKQKVFFQRHSGRHWHSKS